MDDAQKAARLLAVANTFVGVTGFIGPLVQGSGDRGINVRPGLLFGIFGINWAHALTHVITGALGLAAWNDREKTLSYLRLHAVLFSVMALMGWTQARGPQRIHVVMGFAINKPGNVVHTVWALLGLLGCRRT